MFEKRKVRVRDPAFWEDDSDSEGEDRDGETLEEYKNEEPVEPVDEALLIRQFLN